MQLKKPKVFLHKGQFPNRLELSFVILSGQLANEEILHRSILGNTSIVLSVLSKVYVLLRLIFLELSSRLLKWAITFCSYKKLAFFTTNVNVENQTFGYHKTVCVALNRQFLVGAVMPSLFLTP